MIVLEVVVEVEVEHNRKCEKSIRISMDGRLSSLTFFSKLKKNDFFFQNASFFFFELVKKKKMKNQLFVERKLRGGERKAFYLKAVSQRDYTFIPLLFSSSPHNKTMTTKWLNRSNRKSK